MPKKDGDNGSVKVTLDGETTKLLVHLAEVRVLGRTKAEVAGWIVRDWLWNNQERLRSNGVIFPQAAGPKAPAVSEGERKDAQK